MLILEPHTRISLNEVHDNLKDIRDGKLPKTFPSEEKETFSKGSRIKINLKTTKSEKAKEKEDYSKPSRVKFNFPKKS